LIDKRYKLFRSDPGKAFAELATQYEARRNSDPSGFINKPAVHRVESWRLIVKANWSKSFRETSYLRSGRQAVKANNQLSGLVDKTDLVLFVNYFVQVPARLREQFRGEVSARHRYEHGHSNKSVNSFDKRLHV
jgi:hypothetical protein